LGLERLRTALDLAERARAIERALLALSTRDWLAAREKEAAIAEKALAKLDAFLAEIRAKQQAESRERGPDAAPPK
jgi:hypothetical protein